MNRMRHKHFEGAEGAALEAHVHDDHAGHTEHAAELEKPIFDSAATPWKIAAAVLAILFVASMLTGGFSGAAAKVLPEWMVGSASRIDNQGANAGGLLAGSDVVQTGQAKITILEFADYQCPFCKKGFDTMEQVKEAYGDKVEVIFKHFPLSFHQYAEKASEAAECARDQGKFDGMHDKLFENNQNLKVEDLRKYASDLGLDTAKFNACLDGGSKKSVIDADMKEGESRGVTGTPAFFIGDKMISGAQPFDEFRKVIDQKLSGSEEAVSVEESKDPEIAFTVIGKRDCEQCDTSKVIQVTREELFPTVKMKELDYDSAEAKKLVEDLQIKALPAYIFDQSVALAKNFAQVEGALVKKGDKYIINPTAAGSAYYLETPAAGNDPSKGPANAKVTIIIFSDYECPFCGRAEETVKQVEKEYASSVKIVFKEFPLGFHAHAHKAAEAAECAGEQGKYWEMHDLMFEKMGNYTGEGLHPFDWHFLENYAGDLKLDAAKFSECLGGESAGRMASEVDADVKEGGEFGVAGTPHFFVNNIAISGAMPFENFKKVIDAELAAKAA